MSSRILKGLIAGFAATAVVSVLEAVNIFAGPWFTSFPAILAAMLGMNGNLLVGWLAHFAAGTIILGPLFAIAAPKLPTDTLMTKGILFAIATFILMSLTVAPMAGVGAFAMAAGFPTLMWLIFTHIVFGIALGGVFGSLVQREKRQAREMAGAQPAH